MAAAYSRVAVKKADTGSLTSYLYLNYVRLPLLVWDI